jgi:CRP-like cAMP-binding protein
MASCTAAISLSTFIEEYSPRISRPASTILFHRGEKAFGAFLVFSGKVSLHVDVGKDLTRCYGPGTLVGLPATLTKRNYVMTATVTEDAELGFLSPQVLTSLIETNPELCQELLTLLSERVLEIQQVHKALLHRGRNRSCEPPSVPGEQSVSHS